MDFETLELTEEVRSSISGSFLQTSDGFVYYELKGEGECIVLVHGITTPSFIWDPTFEYLVKQGFKVLRYDLFGRGYSERVKTQYDIELFDRQLFELLTKLALTNEKVTLVGLSLGGAICANFATRHQELMRKICFIDPVHPSALPRVMKLLKVPGLNRIILKLAGRKILFDSMAKNFFKYENFPEFRDKFMVQVKYKGYSNAVISTMVYYNFDNLHEVYSIVGTLSIPTCLFWGEEDSIVPYKTYEKIRNAIPTVIFHSIKDAGHLAHYEKPKVVNALLLAFLED